MSSTVLRSPRGVLSVVLSPIRHQTRVDWAIAQPDGGALAGVFFFCRHRLFGELGPVMTYYAGPRPAWLEVAFRGGPLPRVRRDGRELEVAIVRAPDHPAGGLIIEEFGSLSTAEARAAELMATGRVELLVDGHVVQGAAGTAGLRGAALPG